jgi:organic hydroperoxide reductase OsmC/OhrA
MGLMQKDHHFNITINWTGNRGTGTSDYRSYDRSHTVLIEGKEDIMGSSDPAFRGDKSKHNPEDMLISSLASCHMLWYLHLCSDAGVIVLDYTDNATGILIEKKEGGGHFSEITLNPNVIVLDATMINKANELHKKANELCFIANSVNFPVFHKPSCRSVD